VSDDLTPVQIEAKLRRLVNDLAFAQSALREARDEEVNAKHAFEAKHRRSLLSAECPKVTRGGYTTAERDAWVSEEAAELEKAYDLAEARRKAAEDYLRTLRDQSMVVMALGKSVNAAFSMAGVS
jgi:phage-related minor tail protein